jgi:16S rRNA (guanine527-N7)-methyltransferase
MKTTLSHANEFLLALQTHAARYGVRLDADATARLREYYEQVNLWNARLHLVAPCSPAEFATRHVLESLSAVPHLPESARVTDVGTGAGLPLIPCLIVRPDLDATLIESSQKKVVFLREALTRLSLHGAVEPRPFEDVAAPAVSFITCRALDQFMQKLPALINWAPRGSTLLLFGGETLGQQLRRANVNSERFLIPKSEKRYLFLVSD